MPSSHTDAEAALVAWQLGRAPRGPWRVGAVCTHGFPSVAISPPVLDDGTPFPTWAWLTCPWLSREVGRDESAGHGDDWTQRIASDSELAAGMLAADAALRAARFAEAADAGGALFSVGIAGQSDPLKVKCLHAHVALALAGISDPIGDELLSRHGRECPDARCGNAEVGASG